MGVTLHYWAGARAAAGCDSEEVAATTVAEALARARAAHAALGPVIDRSSILVDGRQVPPARRDAPVAAGTVVEVLPPFAGG